MRSIKVKPPYTPLTQQKLCCHPCAIQWILLRNGLPIFTQEEIGKVLKLTVPEEYKHLFGKGVTVPKMKSASGYGSQIVSTGPINQFFKKRKYL